MNRELSWLDFNARVLDLAGDQRAAAARARPLLLDLLVEPGRVLHGPGGRPAAAGAAGVGVRSADGRTPQVALADIRERVIELVVAPVDDVDGRAAHGAGRRGNHRRRRRRAGRRTSWRSWQRRFEREVYPVLTPLGGRAGPAVPVHLRALVSLGVLVRDPEGGEERFARVKVPEVLPRFVPAGASGRLVPLEQVIAHFLAWLFPGMEIVEHAAFRVTRDADFEVSDEADDLLEAVELELRRRRFGDVVRVEVSADDVGGMLEWLKDGPGRRAAPDVPDRRPARPGRPEADRRPRPARAAVRAVDRRSPAPRLRPAGERTTSSRRSARGDLLVHLPYDSFATSVEAFVRAAADRPGRGRAEDDRLPDERRLGAAAGADRGGRGRASRRCAWSS